MSKIRITIEIEQVSEDGKIELVRETKELCIDDNAELESIDACEKRLLEVGYDAMRGALGSQMGAVSKKKSNTQKRKS